MHSVSREHIACISKCELTTLLLYALVLRIRARSALRAVAALNISEQIFAHRVMEACGRKEMDVVLCSITASASVFLTYDSPCGILLFV